MLAQDTSAATSTSTSTSSQDGAGVTSTSSNGPGSADGSESPLTNLPAVSTPEDLGPYAAALSAAPEAALTVSGLLLGAIWGGLIGWGVGAIAKQNAVTWALAGAAAGGTALGVMGYLKGQELDTWLQTQTTPTQSTAPTPSTTA
jgi:hypothetical protein